MGFAACCYNGQNLHDKFVEKLKDYVEYYPVCAEVEIGLGCPAIRFGWCRRMAPPACISLSARLTTPRC
ncbi:hypothetical protein [Acetobacterium wieringae]|uniref:hypothetical protein n=1 Tax=Acetobacterium wieringae TaxID=52694 RepID=UPI00350E4DE8